MKGGAVAAVAVGLAACAAPPPAPLTAPDPAARPAAGADDLALRRFQRVQLDRAEAAESQGRLADAHTAYEVLALLQPDGAHAAKAAQLGLRIDAEVALRMPRAEAAQRRGDHDQAAQLYLEVLALAPAHAGAADALRQLERERNRRQFVGKFSRQTLTRRAAADAEMNGSDEPAAPGATRNQIEHATLLARQGDVEAAIALLRETGRPADAPSRALLADLYVQRAEAQLAREPRAALAAVTAALSLDPAHAAARALARRLGIDARRAP